MACAGMLRNVMDNYLHLRTSWLQCMQQIGVYCTLCALGAKDAEPQQS